MSINEETYDLIDAYYKGELFGESLDIFHAKMKNDPAFKLAYEKRILLIKAIERNKENELKKLLKSEGKVEYFQNVWSTKWVIASSIIVLIFSIAYLLIDLNKTDHITISESRQPPKPVATVDSIQKQISDSIIASDSLTDHLVVIDQYIEEEESIMTQEIKMPQPAQIEIVEDDEIPEEKFEMDKETPKAINLEEIEKIVADSLLFVTTIQATIFSTNTETFYKDSKRKRRNKEASQKKSSTFQQIKVEYWKSSVYDRGYKFFSNRLQLFGINPSTAIEIMGLEKTFFLKKDGTLYKLLPNSTFQNLLIETNPKIIEKLNYEP